MPTCGGSSGPCNGRNPASSADSDSSSFKGIIVLVLLMVYEWLCFVCLTCVSIFISSHASLGIKKIVYQMNLHPYLFSTWPIVLECIIALFILPLLTAGYEHIEKEVLALRPYINSLKHQHPYLLPTAAPILAIMVWIFCACQLMAVFRDRFDVVINEKLPKSASDCLGHWWSFFHKPAPGSIAALHVEESVNTTRFLVYISYITYFMWKAALKRIPWSDVQFTSVTTRRFHEDFLLILVAFVMVGLADIVTKGTLTETQYDIFMGLMILVLILIWENVPWHSLFSTEPNHAPRHCGDYDSHAFKPEMVSAYNHAAIYSLTIIMVIYLFFEVGMPQHLLDKVAELEKILVESGDHNQNQRVDDSEIELEMVKREIDMAVRNQCQNYRLVVGLSLLMAIRTVTGSL